MTRKILIDIRNRYIKGIVIKTLYEEGLEFMESQDDSDLQLKLELFRDTILFFIIEIKEECSKKQYDLIKKLKDAGTVCFPVLAVISNNTKEIVGGAKKAGIEDVILIPEKKDQFRDYFLVRLKNLLEKSPLSKKDKDEKPAFSSILSSKITHNDLLHEIKRAGRGKYSLSFVMGRLTGIESNLLHAFYDRLKNVLRDTDRVIFEDPYTFIVVCPFTVKAYVKEVENKVRAIFEKQFGNNTRFRRMDMYGVSYPDDGTDMENLIGLLEKGVHDSIVISNIREPLNSLSRERLEEYKRMLRIYRGQP